MTEPSRTPEELLPLIKKDIQSAAAATLPHYRKVGELLQEAECQFDDFGKWGKWLKKHFDLDYETAWKYLQLAPTSQFIAPTRGKVTNG